MNEMRDAINSILDKYQASEEDMRRVWVAIHALEDRVYDIGYEEGKKSVSFVTVPVFSEKEE